jgi:hypothetical protein
MFDEFGPASPPLPPAGALEQAITRGRKIRRQRRVGMASTVVLGTVVIGGFAVTGNYVRIWMRQAALADQWIT